MTSKFAFVIVIVVVVVGMQMVAQTVGIDLFAMAVALF